MGWSSFGLIDYDGAKLCTDTDRHRLPCGCLGCVMLAVPVKEEGTYLTCWLKCVGRYVPLNRCLCVLVHFQPSDRGKKGGPKDSRRADGIRTDPEGRAQSRDHPREQYIVREKQKIPGLPGV